MKYPLAHADKLLTRYGSDIALAYDIACAFTKTLATSSVGPRADRLKMRGIVPAFHGHAHNRGCQVWWHPMYIEGAGIEDFEECERTFSKSNELASGTRLATPFHQHQQIEEHFLFHDEDKHAGSGKCYPLRHVVPLNRFSGKFIYQNYRQALGILWEDGAKLHMLLSELQITTVDLEGYLESERTYLQSLKVEPPEVSRAASYMEVLGRLEKAAYVIIRHLFQTAKFPFRIESAQAKVEFEKLDYLIIQKGYSKKDIARVRTRYQTTHTRWVAINEEACRLEDTMSIDKRWTPDMQEYQAALVTLQQRKYRRALDHLEHLVVQRLFELTKLGMSGIGKHPFRGSLQGIMLFRL